MSNLHEKDLKKYKLIALVGLIIMAIGSYVSCLAESSTISMIGTVMLCVSIVIMTYAFYFWRP